MKKVLLSAFACEPNKGSEPGGGWNWATGLASQGFEVHCLTWQLNKPAIELVEKPKNLHFHYIALPFKLHFLYRFSQGTMYIHYIMWQWLAYKKGKSLHKKLNFDIVHHVSWGNLQMGSYLYKIKAPFILGPAGGGQKAPEAFKDYFLGHWQSEIKREKIGEWLLKNYPACKNAMKNAQVVLAANEESLQFAKAAGAKNCFLYIDHALAESYFPQNFVPKKVVPGTLKLLWVGRFMPRKGLPLVLDVMARLKNYENITLTIVGYGELENKIIEKIKENSLEKTVKMTGKIPYEQVKEYYLSHDIFFFTSLRDSGPAQLTEAMAYGLPIVTINLHGQGFIVNDETGIRCKCDTPQIAIEELEKAILYLYNNPENFTAMSQAAHDFAKRQTWPAKISNIVKKYYAF
jgi:glycosyltransferase involved in cell wall biosynthesis